MKNVVSSAEYPRFLLVVVMRGQTSKQSAKIMVKRAKHTHTYIQPYVPFNDLCSERDLDSVGGGVVEGIVVVANDDDAVVLCGVDLLLVEGGKEVCDVDNG
jgi:hypothetical protein